MSIESNVRKWYANKTKLYKKADLDIIYKYIKPIGKTKRIRISNDYHFKYIKSQFENIRFENIFKLSWMMICKRLTKYFPKINIVCKFEVPSIIDCEIKKLKSTFKHDIYITICNNKNDRNYDCVIEYFEKASHTIKSVDNNKEIYTIQIVDQYIVYREENDMKNFYSDTIHKILLLICASTNDNYTLSKINFFKNNISNIIKLKKQTVDFNKIITFHRNNKFNFESFLNEFIPINPDTEEEFTMNEFIEYLKEFYKLIVCIDETGNCSYELFGNMIMLLDINISEKLIDFKKIYNEATNIMFKSQSEIITYINEINNKKKNIPRFISNFLENHIDNVKMPFAQKKAYEHLARKFNQVH